ncbi:MAG: BrnT family toxin [Richelia sp. RM2_1_2]|nr:BrnT family toxin [Nostocales cyanobacterium 94392]NJM23627.1 BrnT family toxin [Richelia sp. SM1_7_0]NJN06962.1 BrnT family toxin [Richelia sp. RM1_1_1]NJO60164.1 BrnT family toxin [Richelia sp. RM2_1_2]
MSRTVIWFWASLQFLLKNFPIQCIQLDYDIHCSYTVGVCELRFEWDERKAISNKKKHGISFSEAETVFYDENARLLYDIEHSSEEDRYILIGMSDSLSLLVVCHVYQEDEEVIRIFSARRANKREQEQYQSFFYER